MRLVLFTALLALAGYPADADTGTPVLVDDEMSAAEIAARLMSPSVRAQTQVNIEEEWGDPELTCTPFDVRGGLRDAGEDVIRRPRLRLKVTFALNSTDVDDESSQVLRTIVEALNDPMIAENRFIVVGHTDATGSAGYNQRLSEKRAKAVRDFLVGNGIDSSRLQMIGCGESMLLDADDPEADANRRVEIINGGDVAQ